MKIQKLILAAGISISLLAAIATYAGTLTGKVLAGKVVSGNGPSVVYVEAIEGKTFPAPAKPIVIDQEQLVFQPHITVAPVGATVSFQNRDRVAHNIFWPSVGGNKQLKHNLGTWPTGESRSFKFDVAGVVPLLCNVHPEMSAYLVVVPTPFYAVTDDSGAYTLGNLPDGQYRVSAWHEGMKVQTKLVSVANTASLDFALAK